MWVCNNCGGKTPKLNNKKQNRGVQFRISRSLCRQHKLTAQINGQQEMRVYGAAVCLTDCNGTQLHHHPKGIAAIADSNVCLSPPFPPPPRCSRHLQTNRLATSRHCLAESIFAIPTNNCNSPRTATYVFCFAAAGTMAAQGIVTD